MRRWLKRFLGARRRRRPTKSYETLSSPYPPLLAELDALVQRPVRLCHRETHTVEFYVDTVERTFARYGLDVRSRTFAVVAPADEDGDDDTVVLKGRTHTGRPWMVTITRADPCDSDVIYYARVRLGDCRHDDLVVCPIGSPIAPRESLI